MRTTSLALLALLGGCACPRGQTKGDDGLCHGGNADSTWTRSTGGGTTAGEASHGLGELGADDMSAPDGIAEFSAGDFGLTDEVLLDTLDWREIRDGYATSPRDQGEAGTCVPFAGVAALESSYLIQTGESLDLDLSEQHLVNCTDASTAGYYIDRIAADLEETGTVEEGLAPYTATDDACDNGLTMTHRAITAYHLDDDQQIRAALHIGPVLTRFDVYDDFFDYAEGLYRVTAGSELRGGHAVELVGYDEQGWIAKNSWGSDWGDDGYFRIAYGESAFAQYGYLFEVSSTGLSRGPALLGVIGGVTDNDGDGWPSDAGDCDDNDATRHPGATEVCDGVDQDCDGHVDEDGATSWFLDNDDDGRGQDAETVDGCDQPAGYAASGGDCDDGDPNRYPGASEQCDGDDDDCDGVVDDGVAYTSWYPDIDADGSGGPSGVLVDCAAPSGYAASSDDCDDHDSSIHPGATEVCDEVDQDCTGVADDGVMCGVDVTGGFCTGSDQDIFEASSITIADPGTFPLVTATWSKCDRTSISSAKECHVRVGSYLGSYDAALVRTSFVWSAGSTNITTTFYAWPTAADWAAASCFDQKLLYLICGDGDWNHWRSESAVIIEASCL